MKRGFVFLLIFFVLIINIVSASFDVGNLSHSIQKSYGPSDYIKGWINISLNGESADSLFVGDEGGSTSLIDLIKLNNLKKGTDYTCNPLTCEAGYSANDSQTETFDLSKGKSILFGFNLSGNDVKDLFGFSFDLISNNPESEELPLIIDILDDGKIEWQAYTASENFGPENSGCFIGTISTSKALLAQIQYCEKIKLSETPEVEIGAYVEGNGEVDFEMSIKKTYGFDKEICTATATGTGLQRISCIPDDFSVNKEEDYFVCIKTKNSADNGKYEIASEQENPCGFAGDIETYDYDFDIFVKPKKYAQSISFTLNNTESLITDIEGYIENYLGEKYNDDCPNGCAIPIKILSGVNQSISISNTYLQYTSGIVYETETFYNIQKTSATIDANFQKLYLDEGNFSVPKEIGDYSFMLSLGEEEIFSEEVAVEKVPVIENLKPRTTAAAYPTTFEVTVESEGNITEYKWEFGDNHNETTSTNKITHTYESKDKYKLKVTVKDANQRSSSRVFDIDVGSPKEIINKLLEKMLEDLSNVKEQIKEFPLFFQNSLESNLDIKLSEEKLSEIQQANAIAVSEMEYSSILKELLKLDIPESITISMNADSISYYPDETNINLDILKIIGGGDYDASDEDKYIEAIFGWNQENIETKITFKELSAKYEYSEEPLLKTFELNINKKNETSNPYLILRQIDNLEFKEDYSERNESGYIYINLIDDQTTITFSTTEDVSFIDLPLFISPSINELSIIEIPNEKDEQLLKIAIFILILFLLVVVGIVTYIILQEWYKKKYENYLFKNRNDLYNLISYTQSSKKKGIKNKEIFNKLKKSGWKSEQISYVMQKYLGKKIGMPEIPVGKILSKFKKDKSIHSTKQKVFTHNPNLKKKKIFF